MDVEFFKMSGAGNDFIVIDNRENIIKGDINNFVKQVCTRRLSIGADGLILVEKSNKADFRMCYYNADGSEAEMCGNGGRCVARFAYLKGIVHERMKFETLAGVMEAEIAGRNVKLKMSDPTSLKLGIELLVNGSLLKLHFINTGVPHAVCFVDDLENTDVFNLGKSIRYHTEFQPKGTNANFAKIIDSNNIEIRTYERGVENETLACGTGAAATALIGAALGKVKPVVSMKTRSGFILKIHFTKKDDIFSNLFLEGNAAVIYEGKMREEALFGNQ